MTSGGMPNASAASSMSVLSSSEGSSDGAAPAVLVFFVGAAKTPRLLNSCTQTPYGRGEPSGSGVSPVTLRTQPWRQSLA